MSLSRRSFLAQGAAGLGLAAGLPASAREGREAAPRPAFRVEGERLSMGRQLTQQHDLLLTDGIDNAIDDRLRGAFLRARSSRNRTQRDRGDTHDERAVRPAMSAPHASAAHRAIRTQPDE